MAVTRPEPSLPKITHPTAGQRSAEQYVAAVFRLLLGASKVRVTQASGDHGLDVIAQGYSAQVKHYTSRPVGRPDIQRLVGATRSLTTGVFFTSSRYTEAAKAYASHKGVALFVYDLLGQTSPRAVNKAAKRLLNDVAQPIVIRKYGMLRLPLSNLARDPSTPPQIARSAQDVLNYLKAANEAEAPELDP